MTNTIQPCLCIDSCDEALNATAGDGDNIDGNGD